MKLGKATLATALAAPALVAGAALLGPSVAPAAHDVEHPNVILIVSDDQSFDSVDKMPYLRNQDPANGGGWLRFDRAFINNPICCPSRATILSGQWSHHTNVEEVGGAPSFNDTDTIATSINAVGYRTGWVGKYHLGPPPGTPGSATYVPPGWDRFVDHRANPHPQQLCGAGAYYDYNLNVNGNLVCHGSDEADYATDVLAARALDFINRNKNEPFFLTFAPRAPHNGWTAATRHLDHYANEEVPFPPSWNEDTSDKPAWWAARPEVQPGNRIGPMRKQWDTLLALDDAVKAIDERVQELGLTNRTVILYMTDNGYSFGEHRWPDKRCVYDSCTHTPLYVKFGGHNEGWTFPQLVGNEDLAPTLADLARAETPQPPSGSDGQSFASLLRSNQTPSPWDDAVLLRSFNNSNAIDDPHPPAEFAIRTRRWLYGELVHPPASDPLAEPEKELYDLTGRIAPVPDPYQLENVADQPAYETVQTELADRLARMRASP
jgi:N-acetylglucosamine-6-sulfatase